MDVHHHRLWKSFLLLMICVASLLTGCLTTSDDHTVGYMQDENNPYLSALPSVFPGYQADPNRVYTEEALPALERGESYLMFDIQADLALKNGIAAHWYPQYLATPVIAVDRSMTQEKITGWGDLLQTECTVGFAEAPSARFLFAAVSHGLDKHNYLSERAASLLENLQNRGQLRDGDLNTPVLICFDYQAAHMIQNGRDLEIIVPSEGTLTYQMGILSAPGLEASPAEESVLTEAGLRLTDGSCREGLYPTAAEYLRADTVADAGDFAQQVELFTPLFQRKILHNRLYCSSGQIEHILFAVGYIVIAILWMGFSMRRIPQRDIRRLILAVGYLTSGWLLLRCFKYQLDFSGDLNRYCWYGFYIFQLALPLVLLWLAMSIDTQNRSRHYALWGKIFAVTYLVLVAIVFTNDLHGQVFVMDLNQLGWVDDYSYGPLYYVVYAQTVLPIFAATFILIKKAWRGTKKAGILFPLLCMAALIAYGLAYIFRIPFIYNSDFTFVACVFSLLYFESAMQTGLIPINRKYSTLFSLSPLKMQIVNANGKTQIASAGSTPVSRTLWSKICDSPGLPVPQDHDTLLYADAIPGGAVIWQENIRELRLLQSEIRENVRRLTAANKLLLRERENQFQMAASEEKMRLMKMLENEINLRMQQMTEKIRALPQAENQRMEIARITLLLCYIKRRCNLFFREQEDRSFPVEELAVYVDELAEFASYAGVRMSTACTAKEPLSPRQGTLLYDFFYAVLAACTDQEEVTVLEQLTSEPGGVMMKLLPSSFDEDAEIFEKSLKQEISAANGVIAVKKLDDTAGISLFLPLGGGADGSVL